ncbi:uncharacterized protein LOC119832520 [Zerene cesonia]|uniref:uncharacterized protein LOC119832520 n=1 Tax=Zerene cesonia TaxID=33412 RepID=UPI0018E54600|nr:uncharacterized protein LOC119832520 [Zerene cesonia]
MTGKSIEEYGLGLRNSVNNAWNNIVKAIKRPVKIRRLGRTGRTKSPRTTVSTTPTRYLIKLTRIHQHHDTWTTPSTTTKTLTKLVIPVLMQPNWRIMFDWRNGKDVINKPEKTKDTMKSERYTLSEFNSNINKVSEDDSQHYGNLFFV